MEQYIEKTIDNIDSIENDKQINNQMIIDGVLIDGRSTGLFGRTFLKFVMANGGNLQFENDCEFQIGDTVGFRTTPISKSNYEIVGEIYKIKSNKIIISIDCDDPILFNSFVQPYKWVQEDYSFIKFSIDKIRINQKQILKKTLKSLNINDYNKHINLFDNTTTTTNKDHHFICSELVLNNIEKELLSNNNNNNILTINNSNNSCKVKTITEIINHIIKLNNNDKILVYSSSNESIDYICNGLLDGGMNNVITKIGYSTDDTITKESNINKITLEYKIKHSNSGSIKQIKQDIIQLGNNVFDSKKSDLGSCKSKVIELKKDLNKLEKSLINKTINESQVVLSSSTVSLEKYLNDKNDHFDWVIIDEPNQTLNINCWVPILKGKKLIVISDHHHQN